MDTSDEGIGIPRSIRVTIVTTSRANWIESKAIPDSITNEYNTLKYAPASDLWNLVVPSMDLLEHLEDPEHDHQPERSSSLDQKFGLVQ